jgi:ADP-ribosylglycohydrolase/tetratricopeptide (TPR) repeat protein
MGDLRAPAAVSTALWTDGARIVDRQHEMGTLVSALAADVDHRPRGGGLLLVGEAGVGKSRVIDELESVARHRGIDVLRATCIATSAEALLPIRESLIDRLGLEDYSLDRAHSRLPAGLADLAPFIRTFVESVIRPGIDVAQLGGSTATGLYTTLATLLRGMAEPRGLCLIVESLERADPDTLSFMNYLLPRVRPGRGIVVVCTAQRDPTLEAELDNWTARGLVERIELGPLPEEFVSDLISDLAGTAPSPEEAARLHRETGGNPFWIIELLAESRREELGLVSTHDTMSPRLVAVLRRRLREADLPTHEFLEAASVALELSGGAALVSDLAGLDNGQYERLLRRAHELRFMRDGPELEFTQELMRRFIYDQIIDHKRRRLHREAARHLESAGRLTAAAHHYARAKEGAAVLRVVRQAGPRSEREGTYRSALELYELVPSDQDIGLASRRAIVLMVLGQFHEAEDLLRELPAQHPDVLLGYARLNFLRGDMCAAEDTAARALEAGPADCAAVEIQLADIHLHMGNFVQAAFYAEAALGRKDSVAYASTAARAWGVIWATQHFAGNLADAAVTVEKAMELSESCDPRERDCAVAVTILDNAGQSRQAVGDWDGARARHRESLALCRESADARGQLVARHAIARTHLLSGDPATAAELLEGLRGAAEDIGSLLDVAKIDRTAATLALLRDDLPGARELTRAALTTFQSIGTAYDVAEANLGLAQIAGRMGEEREAIWHGFLGRSAVERSGFGLLQSVHAAEAFSYSERISAALLAYACGDALGLPWEMLPANLVRVDAITALPPRTTGGWDRGDTSDDTALTLLVAEYLSHARSPDGLELLSHFSSQRAGLKGLGPSTTAAIAHFERTGSLAGSEGNTNGGVMRALPIGWAIPCSEADRRRDTTLELTSATHAGREALAGACVMTACASWALEGASGRLILEVAQEEAAWAEQALRSSDGLKRSLERVAAGRWEPGPGGPEGWLSPLDTVTSVLDCVVHADSLGDALIRAVARGGDTDTVAALVGGLWGSRLSPADVLRGLPWHPVVRLPSACDVTRLAFGVSSRRIHG